MKKWKLLVGLCTLGLLYLGLRFERQVSKCCPVCASELILRQRGMALSESRRLWARAVTEEVIESGVKAEFLGPDHQHTWQTWSDLYIAFNGRSGGHPSMEWNPAARAWRYNARFQSAVRNFAAADPQNHILIREMFLLPARPARDGSNEAVVATTIEKCKALFVGSGEVVPPGWLP